MDNSNVALDLETYLLCTHDIISPVAVPNVGSAHSHRMIYANGKVFLKIHYLDTLHYYLQ